MLRRISLTALLALIAAVGSARAQTRWVVDSKSSSAWWQINPHMNHLWATTCPQEPSWRPGEGRSAGWYIDQMLHRSKTGFANASDTVNVPLYPRHKVRAVCGDAVKGLVLAPESGSWSGLRGQVTVRANALISGENMRDRYAGEKVLETNRYPEIKFTLDSLNLAPGQRGDTLRGMAYGIFTLRGVGHKMAASFRSWPEAGGQRVLAKFHVPATTLTQEFGVSKIALGLGVETRIWRHLFMGVDLLLKREGAAGGAGN